MVKFHGKLGRRKKEKEKRKKERKKMKKKKKEKKVLSMGNDGLTADRPSDRQDSNRTTDDSAD